MTKSNSKTNRKTVTPWEQFRDALTRLSNEYCDEEHQLALKVVNLRNSAAKIYSNDREFEETDTTYRNHMLTEAFKLRIQIDDLPIEKQKSDIIQGAYFTLQLLIDRYSSV